MILQRLKHKLNTPTWLIDNTMYLTRMGSFAYGVNDNNSDQDYYGFTIPPKEIVFPHLAGYISGFDKQIHTMNVWQQHHVLDDKTSYDFAIYNIVHFFRLCMDNNPNMIDSLFVSENCIVHSTHIAELIRKNRKIFLHKGAWHKFKGYAYSQLSKLNRIPTGPRRVVVEKFGYDLKFAYHLIRLLNEVEQILYEGDLNLLKSKEQLKSIRNGEWTEQRVRNYFTIKEIELEKLYHNSELQYSPDITEIKKLLIKCLEMHYQSLPTEIDINDQYIKDLQQIADITSKYL